jgi:hypothetical protein
VAAAGLPAITYASSIVINPANTNVVYVSGSVRDYPNAGPAKTIFRTTMEGPLGPRWPRTPSSADRSLRHRDHLRSAMAPGARTPVCRNVCWVCSRPRREAQPERRQRWHRRQFRAIPDRRSQIHALYAVTHGRC